jgi:hypothetical protein
MRIEQNVKDPGTAATVSGAEFQKTHLKTEEYRIRAERATLACDALAACHPDDAQFLVAGFYKRMCAGMPQAPLFGIMDQAAFWADVAMQAELKAYCLASYTRMDPCNQAAFWAFVGRLAA